ncbi:hypothetical protein Hanom_Chr15g01375521 [Helianthus anomalus]
MKLVQSRLKYCSDTPDMFKRQYEVKQQIVNSYIEEVAELKRKMADLEQDNIKLQSSEYHQVPLPEKFAFYDDEKVEKAFNMVDQLPDNIDVTYSKSDKSCDSEVVGMVVESVLKEESVETGKSESQDENGDSFHEGYLKNSKSEKKENDDSKGLVYTMIGSDKLFSDVYVPI